MELRDLLYQFRAGDTRGTFTRGSAGTYVDQDGVLQSAASDVERVTWLDLNGDGVREPYLLMEGARTQLVTNPENFGVWTVSGSPGVTGGQPDPARGTAAYLLEDDNAGLAEAIYQSPSFTGDATKAFAIFLKAGTASVTDLQIHDATLGPSRHTVRVTWTNGVPTLTTNAGAGTLYPPLALGGGWYLIWFTAENIVATSDNRFWIFPASQTTSATGTVYVYGANAWDAEFPSSYQGPSLSSRSADQLDLTVDLAQAREWAMYLRLWDPGLGVATVDTAYDLFFLSDENGSFGAVDDRIQLQRSTSALFSARWTTPVEGAATSTILASQAVQEIVTRHRARDHALQSELNAATGSYGSAPTSHGNSAIQHDTLRLGFTGGVHFIESLLIARSSPTTADLAFAARRPYLAFTDDIGQTFLPCAVPHLAGWRPDYNSISDRAFALADGAPFRFEFRDDYLADFAIPNLKASELPVALRLKEHLIDGGSLVIVTQDKDNNVYTVKLAPDTEPEVAFADPQALEYTFRASVRNTAAAVMAVRY